MRWLLLLAGLTALTACARVAESPVDNGPSLQRCDAGAHQSLIGTHVGAVSFPADANVRIVCTTCPTTKDYRPDRLNVRFDQQTGIIRSLDCG